jgi:hypothetical protein
VRGLETASRGPVMADVRLQSLCSTGRWR